MVALAGGSFVAIKEGWFDGASRRAKTSEKTTTALVTAETASGASAAAPVEDRAGDDVTHSVTIRTHYQITEDERQARGPSMNDHASARRKRAAWSHARTWNNSSKDRHNGGYAYFGPGWAMPRVLATVTASIVWGIYGSMADMPDYTK